MYRIDHATGTTTDPGTSTPISAQPRYFTGGDPVTGTAATILEAEWLNMIQEELVNAVLLTQPTLNKGDRTQLRQALQTLTAGTGYVAKAGDTMTGRLVMAGDGVSYPGVGTRNGNSISFDWNGTNVAVYVDQNPVPLGTIPNGGPFLPLTGGTLTGGLNGTDISVSGSVGAQYMSSGGNIDAAGSIGAAGNVAGLNLYGTNEISTAGTVYGGTSVTSNGTISGGFLNSDSGIQAATDVAANGNVSAGGNVTAGVNMTATGNITAGIAVLAGGTGDFGLMLDGGFRKLRWNGDWSMFWEQASGHVNWSNDQNQNLMTLYGSAAGLQLWFGTGVKPGGGAWDAPSDERLKKNVADYDSGLAQVCALRPITFEYNGEGGTADDGITYHGLIAQEVEQVMPEMVYDMSARMHASEAQPRMLSGQLAMNATALTYAMVNAVKELATRLETLEGARARP